MASDTKSEYESPPRVLIVDDERLRAHAKITSQSWRPDLGQIWPIRNRETTGIAGLLRGFRG